MAVSSLRRCTLLRALLIGSSTLVSFPALAQATAEADAEADERNGGLAEIIVTAERREQNLQDIPVSASVFTGEQLEQRGVQNLNDIQQIAPSIAINTFNRSTFINIRGVGIAQSAPTSNPGVAYYIDGQLIPLQCERELAGTRFQQSPHVGLQQSLGIGDTNRHSAMCAL